MFDGSYDQISYSFQAVRCLDSQDASVREAQRAVRRGVSKAAPVLGRLGGPDLTCALWPVRVGAEAADASTATAPRRSW